jgi:hypothetical protein
VEEDDLALSRTIRVARNGKNSKKPALAEAVGSIIGGTENQNVNSGLLVFSAPYGHPEGAAKNISPACVFSPLFFAR